MNARTPTAVALLMGLTCVLGGCSKPPEESADSDILFPAPTFTLVDQDEKPFDSTALKGKTWIVTLFYTNCPGPCPMMTGRLKKIQDAIDDPNVAMVSVSIDPDHDTPAKMKDYANAVGAKVGRWYFLTGTPEQVARVADGLHLGFEPPKENAGQIVHSTKFLLMDKAGQCRGVYSTDDPDSMKRLEADTRKLAAT